MSIYLGQMEAVLEAWRPYIDNIQDWQQLVAGVEPKPTGCGPVYELPNPLNARLGESFAIADMRELAFSEPHYHPNGETEIYIVLQGRGRIVVGGQETMIEKGSAVITPPDTTHFVIPSSGLVLAVINTPSFNPENYVPIIETSSDVGFNREQFERLTNETV